MRIKGTDCVSKCLEGYCSCDGKENMRGKGCFFFGVISLIGQTIEVEEILGKLLDTRYPKPSGCSART